MRDPNSSFGDARHNFIPDIPEVAETPSVPLPARCILILPESSLPWRLCLATPPRSPLPCRLCPPVAKTPSSITTHRDIAKGVQTATRYPWVFHRLCLKSSKMIQEKLTSEDYQVLLSRLSFQRRKNSAVLKGLNPIYSQV